MPDQIEIGSERERVEGRVRRWCDRARLDGRRPLLSDAAAIAIAAGRIDDTTHTVLAARRRVGKSMPSIGGYSTVRVLTDERQRWLAKDTRNKPGSALVYKLRAAELGKRLDQLRTAFVVSPKHYANGVRAVRRERREGLHLELDQRDALFDALAHTPVPRQRTANIVERAGLSILDTAADRVAEASRSTRFEELGNRASTLMLDLADQRDDAFGDRYETILFVAGSSVDRVHASPAWRSEHFLVQRTQLDLTDELTQVAVDVNSLRAMMFDAATRARVASRRAALDSVWTQLIDRVAALVRVDELVHRAEGELRTMDVMHKAHSLDDRIDALVARAGNREISADNTNFVGDQLRHQ